MGSLVSDGRDPCPVITGEGPGGRGGRAEGVRRGHNRGGHYRGIMLIIGGG